MRIFFRGGGTSAKLTWTVAEETWTVADGIGQGWACENSEWRFCPILGSALPPFSLRYLKIISCWPRTAKSTEGCNCLIISDRLLKNMQKRCFLLCKSYAFMVWKLSNDSVKAMLLHRKVIAFTKQKVRKHSFLPLIAVFYALFFSSLHFFVDKIQRAKSPKCPILRILN